MDKEILKIALNTENFSFLSDYTKYAKLKNKFCGDEIKVYIKTKNKKIIDFKYEGESCVYCQASASLLSRNIKNKSINNIVKLFKISNDLFENKKNNTFLDWKIFLKIMKKSNIDRKDCLLLPIRATIKALKN